MELWLCLWFFWGFCWFFMVSRSISFDLKVLRMVEAVERGSFMEKINEKIHEYKESSSSDSEGEQPSFRKKRLFGRKEPVHAVLGGGKCKNSSFFFSWKSFLLCAVCICLDLCFGIIKWEIHALKPFSSCERYNHDAHDLFFSSSFLREFYFDFAGWFSYACKIRIFS